jgi:DNA-binding MarR family transcriptional regulator
MNSVSLHSMIGKAVSNDTFGPVSGRAAPIAADPVDTCYRRIHGIRRYIAARAGRGRFFNPRLFADPAWDMLLELYVASLAQRRLQVSRLVERSGVPMTTALRWINALEREGLVKREPDVHDSRLVLLSLTDKGRRAMDDYFAELPIEGGLL